MVLIPASRVDPAVLPVLAAMWCTVMTLLASGLQGLGLLLPEGEKELKRAERERKSSLPPVYEPPLTLLSIIDRFMPPK